MPSATLPLTRVAAAIVVCLLACGRPAIEPSDPAVRLVQTIMQGELRQRWLRVDRPKPDTLRLTFQDEGLRKASIEQLDSYARVVAARALNLLAPPPADLPEGLRVVSVRMERSHRLGPLVWLGKVTTYTLDARLLRPPMKGRGTLDGPDRNSARDIRVSLWTRAPLDGTLYGPSILRLRRMSLLSNTLALLVTHHVARGQDREGSTDREATKDRSPYGAGDRPS